MKADELCPARVLLDGHLQACANDHPHPGLDVPTVVVAAAPGSAWTRAAPTGTASSGAKASNRGRHVAPSRERAASAPITRSHSGMSGSAATPRVAGW